MPNISQDEVVKLFAKLLDRDKPQLSIDNGVLTIVANGTTTNLPIGDTGTIRSSISKY
jgi:hypothetical protein